MSEPKPPIFFVKYFDSIAARGDLTPLGVLHYGLLAGFILDRKGKLAYPTHEQMAERLHCDVKTTGRMIHELEQTGYIRIDSTHTRVNATVYDLLIEPSPGDLPAAVVNVETPPEAPTHPVEPAAPPTPATVPASTPAPIAPPVAPVTAVAPPKVTQEPAVKATTKPAAKKTTKEPLTEAQKLNARSDPRKNMIRLSYGTPCVDMSDTELANQRKLPGHWYDKSGIPSAPDDVLNDEQLACFYDASANLARFTLQQPIIPFEIGRLRKHFQGLLDRTITVKEIVRTIQTMCNNWQAICDTIASWKYSVPTLNEGAIVNKAVLKVVNEIIAGTFQPPAAAAGQQEGDREGTEEDARRHGEYLESLTPEQRQAIMDAAWAEVENEEKGE